MDGITCRADKGTRRALLRPALLDRDIQTRSKMPRKPRQLARICPCAVLVEARLRFGGRFGPVDPGPELQT